MEIIERTSEMFRRIAVAVGIVVVIVSTLSLATYLGSRNASVLLADTGKSGDPALEALAGLSIQVSMLNKSVSLQQDLITELSGNIVALEAQLDAVAACACGTTMTEVVTVSTLVAGPCVPLVPITDTSSITYAMTIATATGREPDDDPIAGPPAAPPVAIVPPAATPTPPIPDPVPPTPPDDDVPPPNDKQHCNQGLGNGSEDCSPGQSDNTVNPNHPHGPNDETEPVTPGQPGRPDDKLVPPGQEDKPCKGNKCS